MVDLYPHSQHVYLIGLDQAEDLIVWQYAQPNDFTVVTKDSDFSELSVLQGFPPKVIWIRRGSCSTRQIETMLRSHHETIQQFGTDTNLGVLTLY
ncbi:MAG: DUF5615 family PIN-like protein [Leptolyngbyaceae cyanobacterium]